ncbi:hypothetical protein MMC30_008929 [Trapelia coarctata]|nr:hypothetical protein [Trapelia coarctata]
MAKQPLGFLDIPPEIRLQIYDELLIFCSRYGYCSGRYYRSSIMSDYGGDNEGSSDNSGFSNFGRYISYQESDGCICIKSNAGKYERLSPETITASADIYPAILSTCKTIAREAAPVLYGNARFIFRLHSIDLGRLARSSRRVQAVEKLYDFSAEHRQWPYRTPRPLARSQFAVFLRKIGPTNASFLTSVRFNSGDVSGFETQMPVVRELVVQHCRGLRNLSVHLAAVKEKIDRWDSPEWHHPSKNSPFWMNGDFRIMFLQLERFVTDVTSLRSFEYTGQKRFPDVRDGMAKLAGLTELVKTRWEEAEEEARARARANEREREDCDGAVEDTPMLGESNI